MMVQHEKVAHCRIHPSVRINKGSGLVGRLATSLPSIVIQGPAGHEPTGPLPCRCSGDELLCLISQHRFSAEGPLSRDGRNWPSSHSSPPVKPMRRKSNESGICIGEFDNDDSFDDCSSFDSELLAQLGSWQVNHHETVAKDEHTALHLLRCSTVPGRIDRGVYSPLENENTIVSPRLQHKEPLHQKKKAVKACEEILHYYSEGTVLPPRVVFVSMHEEMPLHDDDDETLTSEMTEDDKVLTKVASLVIRTRSYSMSSEKISTKSPSKPIRKGFVDEVPARNASFGCNESSCILSGVRTIITTPTAAAHNSTFVSCNNKNPSSHLTPPLRTPSIKAQSPMSRCLDATTTIEEKPISKNEYSQVSSQKAENSPHKNIFLHNLTWNNVKETSSRRKPNSKSSKG